MPHVNANRALGFSACATAGALWGTGFFFGKIALREMNVGHMVFYRFVFAFLAFIPIMATHRPTMDKKDWGKLLLGALLGVPIQFLIQFKGLSLTTVAHAALMIGTMPVVLAVGAAIFAHERMDKIGWGSLVVSTAGAILIALGGHSGQQGGPSRTGDALVVLSIVIALFWVLLNKHLMERHSALVVTSYTVSAGFLMLCISVPLMYGLPPVHGITSKAWLALAASGVLCTAATTTLWNWGMTQVPASQAGIFLNMEPLIGSLLGIFALGERLAPAAIFGGLLILVSAFVLTQHSETTTKTHALE